MNEMITSKKLFQLIIFVMLMISLVIAYFSSLYLKEITLNKLVDNDANKSANLTFEVLYTKMRDGWSREDLSKIIERLNNLRPGLEIHTYRSPQVEELFGKVPSEKEGFADPLLQQALRGERVMTKTEDRKIRYILPILVKKECIRCHSNTKVGDINGVIDMSFPPTDIKAPLDEVISNFLAVAVVFIILTFSVIWLLINKIFLNPIASFVNSIKCVQEKESYLNGITCKAKTYEIYMLGKTFNELSLKVHETLEKLKCKNKLLEEYKNAIDESTIVTKTDTKGIITYVNSKFCEISGYKEEELIGRNHNMVRSPNMPKEAFKDLWATIKKQKTWHGVVENRAKDGSSYFVQATIIPILNDNDETVEYIGIRQDITALKKFQFQEINDSVNKALEINIKDMLRCLPVNAVIVDKDSFIRYSNHIFQERFLYINDEKIALDSFFIESPGYISAHPVLDWKDELQDFLYSSTNKVLVNTFGKESEFYIFVHPLKEEGFYLVLLIEKEHV